MLFFPVYKRSSQEAASFGAEGDKRANWLFPLISWPIYCQQVEALNSRQMAKVNIIPRLHLPLVQAKAAVTVSARHDYSSSSAMAHCEAALVI